MSEILESVLVFGQGVFLGLCGCGAGVWVLIIRIFLCCYGVTLQGGRL